MLESSSELGGWEVTLVGRAPTVVDAPFPAGLLDLFDAVELVGTELAPLPSVVDGVGLSDPEEANVVVLGRVVVGLVVDAGVVVAVGEVFVARTSLGEKEGCPVVPEMLVAPNTQAYTLPGAGL